GDEVALLGEVGGHLLLDGGVEDRRTDQASVGAGSLNRAVRAGEGRVNDHDDLGPAVLTGAALRGEAGAALHVRDHDGVAVFGDAVAHVHRVILPFRCFDFHSTGRGGFARGGPCGDEAPPDGSDGAGGRGSGDRVEEPAATGGGGEQLLPAVEAGDRGGRGRQGRRVGALRRGEVGQRLRVEVRGGVEADVHGVADLPGRPLHAGSSAGQRLRGVDQVVEVVGRSLRGDGDGSGGGVRRDGHR